MSQKCYDINYLQKTQNKSFIYERKSLEKENIFSYETVIQEINKCMQYLQKYKVEHHVGIAIDLKEHTTSTIILLLSILNYECHFYCLDWEGTKDVDTYLRLSKVKYVISSKDLQPVGILEQNKYDVKILDNIFYLYFLKLDNNIFKNVSLCYTTATSGSTGEPKMVNVPYECIEPNIKALSGLLNIQENDVIFLGSPPTFDPFVIELFVALENFASILITSKEIRLQPQQLLKIMFPGVTIYQTTPSLFRLFSKEIIHNDILNNESSLRCLILGGEHFPSCLELKTWLPLDFPTSGKRIFNIYGITEVSCWSSIYEFDPKHNSATKDHLSLGKPLDEFTSFRLVDEFGNVLHDNECRGELEICSSFRRCYIPQYDNDVKILESNDIIYRKTGDLVERDSTGNIYYIGRTNNTVKRLGKRLCLDSLNKKVENILNAKTVSYTAISLWYKVSTKLILYLVISKKVTTDEKLSILNLLQQNLENHEQPDEIIYNNELPLNRHGKVDRDKLLDGILLKKQKLHYTPVKIFKDFLTNVMGFQMDDREMDSNESLSVKRLKLSTNISFAQAGGTSFQALSLATELAELLEQTEEQRKILEMLLDNSVTIKEILKFLLLSTKKLEYEISKEKKFVKLNSSLNLKLLWRCDLKKCIDATPSIYQEKYVAVGSHSHLLLTVNTTSGAEISRLELNDRIECPVVFVTSQLALVGCYDGFLYGFDFNNGAITWKLNVKGMIKAKPLVVKNIIIVASYAEDYNIMAFDFKSLTLLWRLKLGSKGIFSSPVHISDESVLFCTLDGTYALIKAESGSIKWLQTLDSPIFSTAAKMKISNETLLILAEVKGQISIYKAENGEGVSCFQAEGNIFSGLTVHHLDHRNHTRIIFGCHDKNVYCLNLEHSTRKLTLFWKCSLNSAVYATPILISKCYVLACSTKGLMVVLDLNQADVVAKYDIKAEVFSSPNCSKDKYIYVGCRDNYLYAFELEK